MACGITAGITVTCNDLRRVGGVKQTLWLGNIADLAVPFDPVAIGSNYVSSIPFTVYKSLYKIQGPKFAHSADCKMQVSDAGNVSWEHSVTIRVFNDTPIEDNVLQDMSVAEMFAIVQTNNQEFLMYGIGNGMRGTAGDLPTGKKNGDDPITTLTLTGSEKTVYKRFLIGGDINQTLNYLNAVSN
jgi:hypothetical protein